MPTDPKRVQAVFLAAAEQDPSDRAALLDRQCGSDAELRQRVEALLQAHDAPGSLLDHATGEVGPTINQPILEKPGTLVGPYKLLEQIGEGGMGLVFMARQQEPVKRNVALKLIKPGMDSKQVIARFEAERQAVALMDHPNIARVLDAGSTESGRPYFVMDLVRGIPITKYCDGKRLSNRQRLGLFLSVCQAVQHAHQKGIIHRDLKPTNILVTSRDGEPVPKVIDFGIAKATKGQLTEETLVTNFAQMIGTPLYMSPEQAEMSEPDIDTRSDVFSLGVLLYELLTGTTPFGREQLSDVSFDELRRIIREEEPPKPSTRLSTLDASLETVAEQRATDVRTLRQQLCGELDWIVMKALEKDRTRRYETASDLAKDVLRHLHDEPVEACPPTAAYRLRKIVARNRAAVLTTAVVAAALVIGAVAATVGFLEADKGRRTAVAARRETDEANVRLKDQLVQTQEARDGEGVARREANRNLYVSDMKFAHELYEEGDVAGALKLLKRHRAAYCERFEWRWLWRLCREGDALQTFRAHSGGFYPVAFSTDGLLAATGRGNDAKLFDVASGRELATFSHSSPVFALAFAPDGETLAAAAKDSQITLWWVDTHTKAGTFGRAGPIGTLAFSPDGKTLASGSWGLALIDPASPQQRKTLPGYVKSLAFSHDGKLLAGLTGSLPVRLWDMVERRELDPFEEPHDSYCSAVALSPDGSVLATGSWNTEIKLWDPASRRPLKTFIGHQGQVRSLAFSPPDGQTLASASDDHTIKLWPVGGPDTETLATLRGHTDTVLRVAYSPEGKTLLSAGADGTVKRWPGGGPQPRDVVEEYGDSVSAVAFSPDDSTLATGCFDGTVRLLDVRTLQTKKTLQRHAHQVFSVAFSPSGEWLASCDGVWRVVSGRRDFTAPGAVKLTNLADPRQQINVPEITTGVRAVAFSPDGTTLAIGDHDEWVRIWDVAGRRFTLSIETGEKGKDPRNLIMKMRFAPDGKTLATVHRRGGSLVKLWNATTAESLATFEPTAGYDAAFSPDGTKLATTGARHAVTLWDVRQHEELMALEGNKAQVLAICFSPDGKTLATGSVDHTIKLWSVESGQDVATLGGHHGPVYGLAFSHDGTILASSSSDKTVRLWRTASLEEVRQTATRTRIGG